MGYSPWGHKELDMSEETQHTCTHTQSITIWKHQHVPVYIWRFSKNLVKPQSMEQHRSIFWFVHIRVLNLSILEFSISSSLYPLQPLSQEGVLSVAYRFPGKNKIPLAFTCQASENKDVQFCPFLHHNTKCRILWKLIGQISQKKNEAPYSGTALIF